MAPGALAGGGELLLVAGDGAGAAEHVPHVEGEHEEQRDRERGVQRPPQLVLADVPALAAVAREVLLDLGR